jgi:hypothetical protein
VAQRTALELTEVELIVTEWILAERIGTALILADFNVIGTRLIVTEQIATALISADLTGTESIATEWIETEPIVTEWILGELIETESIVTESIVTERATLIDGGIPGPAQTGMAATIATGRANGGTATASGLPTEFVAIGMIDGIVTEYFTEIGGATVTAETIGVSGVTTPSVLIGPGTGGHG